MSEMQSRAARLEAVLARLFRQRCCASRTRVRGTLAMQVRSPGGETHYNVLLVSETFRGMGRVARSRAVHAVLEAEFAAGLHALSLTLRTPEEAAAFIGRENPSV